MSSSALLQSIGALRSALAATTSLDKESRAALIELHREVGKLIERHGDVPVTERLEELAVRFEADHPAVGAAIREAIAALSRAGI